MTVTVSPNIYKNGINVGVPGTGHAGPRTSPQRWAQSSSRGTSGLTMLDRVTEDDLAAARDLVEQRQGDRQVMQKRPSPLYIKAAVSRPERSNAHAIISGDYTRVIEVGARWEA